MFMIKLNLTSSDKPITQIQECLEFIDKLNEASEKEKEIVIDMRNLKWILPCSALLISHKIKEIINKECKISFIEPNNQKVRDYLSIVGFPLGGGKPAITYMPIHHFSPQKENNSTRLIELEIKEVFDIVQKYFPSKLHNGIFYLLAELSDNIDQHSEFTLGSIMVQFYKNKGFVDIGVLDNGITIPGRYEKNSITFENDCDAIEKALKGISTKEGEVGRGKGLETSKRLVEEGLEGDFYVLSRKCLVSVEKGHVSDTKSVEKPLKGTLIYARFKVPKKALNIYEFIE